MRLTMTLFAAAGLAAACGSSPPHVGPPWLESARVLTAGVGSPVDDCRSGICQHNENTDITTFQGALYLVHRTAKSQILGPNSALHVFRSTDGLGGRAFTDVATLPAELGRDLRDPHFYEVNGTLYLKALARLPVLSARDANVDTVALRFSSPDGTHWTYEGEMGPHGWSFWRIRQVGGTYYTAAYQDGDLSVVLYTSTDGKTWTAGAPIYTTSADTPLETELHFFPSGRLLALVRTDGTDQELLGDTGRLRTQVCWADPPAYDAFRCPGAINGQRFDGPLGFFWQSRLFMLARKHLQPSDRKRTALFELSGDFAHDVIPDVREWGEIPSAGDTAYAGQQPVDDHRVVISWYSSDVVDDENWAIGMLDGCDIWTAFIDLAALR
jgi:hypothetical protein